MVNRNTKEYIDKLKISIFERLQLIEGAPSVQFHDVPAIFSLLNLLDSRKPSFQDG